MMKHSFALLVASLATSMLAGCELYFGGSHNDSQWNYCGSDGYYVCEGDNCTWQGPQCPAGTGGGSATPGGYECTSNTDCAAGCYCANGKCEEAGFCTQDSDCGPGYVCDTMRSSCEPGNPPPPKCTGDSSCPAGQVCDASGACTATCNCASDLEATQQGYGWCDESRLTCMTGSDPYGTCAGEPTCNTIPPTCPSGETPLLGADGCWTGQCEIVGLCGAPPPCSRINDSQDCLSRSGDCSAVYTGLNCTKPDGTACNDGDLNCTCTQFVFNSCRNKTANPRTTTITLDNGVTVQGELVLH